MPFSSAFHRVRLSESFSAFPTIPLPFGNVRRTNLEITMASQFGGPRMNSMDSQSQNTSLQRLHHVEKRVVRVLELAGGVMDELSNSTGPRMEVLNNHCRDFMQSIKDIQVTLREEIKSACEYRPFEMCAYSSRISNEICCKKLEYMIEQLNSMEQSIDQYHSAV